MSIIKNLFLSFIIILFIVFFIIFVYHYNNIVKVDNNFYSTYYRINEIDINEDLTRPIRFDDVFISDNNYLRFNCYIPYINGGFEYRIPAYVYFSQGVEDYFQNNSSFTGRVSFDTSVSISAIPPIAISNEVYPLYSNVIMRNSFEVRINSNYDITFTSGDVIGFGYPFDFDNSLSAFSSIFTITTLKSPHLDLSGSVVEDIFNVLYYVFYDYPTYIYNIFSRSLGVI